MAASFIHGIEEALIAKIETDLGVGSTVYPTPGYLQLRFVGRAAGRPIPILPEQELPAVWIEYLAGQASRSEVGYQFSTSAIESFNILGRMRITPEILGLTLTADTTEEVQLFAREAESAIGILLRRLMNTLLTFDPSVYDEILGYKTNGQRLGGWSYNGATKGALMIDYTLILRYESLVVI